MANVLDSFVLELGLDPAKFEKGSKAAIAGWAKTKEEAVKAGKSIEESGKKAGDSVEKLTSQVLTLMAVFLGARGLKQFTQDLISADAALGRFSVNMGTSPQQIAAWGMAVERVGGSSDALRATMQGLSKSLYELATNGKNLPDELWRLRSLTGVDIDYRHGVDKYMLDIATAAKKLKETDPATAFNLLTALGIDPGTITLMEKYGSGLGKVLDEHKKLAADDKAIKAAQDLQEKWATLQQTAVSLANTVMSTLGPRLEEILTQMTNWVEKNRDWINTKIVEAVQNFSDNLPAIVQGIKDFGSGARELVDALGGVVKASETILAIWAGGKIIGAIATVRTALGVGGAAAGATAAGAGGGGFLAGLMAFAAKLSPYVAMLATSGDTAKGANDLSDWKTADPNSPKFSRYWDEVAAQKGWDKSGPSSRGGIRRTLGDDRETALDDYLNGPVKMPETTTDGKPVGKGNPMPVVIQMPTSGGGGGGFWSTIGNAFSTLFGGSANAAEMPKGAAANSASGEYDNVKPNPGGRGWWTLERQAHAYKRLTQEAGLSDAGARALISRWKNVEASGGPGEVNKIGATGIIQALGARKRRLFQLAKEKGKSWNDYDLQLDHVIEELRTTESRAGRQLRNARTASEGATGASMYERAEGYNFVTGNDLFTNRTAKGVAGVATGASGVLNANTATNNNTTNSSSVNANIGSVTVNTAATDAGGIAGGMVNGIKSQIPALANFGLR